MNFKLSSKLSDQVVCCSSKE